MGIGTDPPAGMLDIAHDDIIGAGADPLAVLPPALAVPTLRSMGELRCRTGARWGPPGASTLTCRGTNGGTISEFVASPACDGGTEDAGVNGVDIGPDV